MKVRGIYSAKLTKEITDAIINEKKYIRSSEVEQSHYDNQELKEILAETRKILNSNLIEDTARGHEAWLYDGWRKPGEKEIQPLDTERIRELNRSMERMRIYKHRYRIRGI